MGSTLVEAIVALAIAAVGLTAFLTTCGVLLQSRAISQELFDQGASINAIHSEVSQFISSHPGESIQTLQAGADAVADRYPDCRLELSAEGPRLYSLVIIFIYLPFCERHQSGYETQWGFREYLFPVIV